MKTANKTLQCPGEINELVMYWVARAQNTGPREAKGEENEEKGRGIISQLF